MPFMVDFTINAIPLGKEQPEGLTDAVGKKSPECTAAGRDSTAHIRPRLPSASFPKEEGVYL